MSVGRGQKTTSENNNINKIKDRRLLRLTGLPRNRHTQTTDEQLMICLKVKAQLL